ncbi:MAG: Spy/CpxP family protein refolding chaperone [Nitrospiraceae bacterium]
MNKQTLIATLALAVLVMGALSVSACHRHRSPAERTDRMAGKIAKELDLNDEQKGKLEAVKAEFLAAQAQMRKEHEALFDGLLAQVQADQLDQAKLLQLFERHQALGARVAPGVVAKVADFHASLTPKQKAEAVEHLKHFRERMHRHDGNAKM